MPSLVIKPTHKPVENPDFARRNVIAQKIEKIISVLSFQALLKKARGIYTKM